ncbi:GNAT family N-acetyltransferase [Fusibacter ferrireducens]|uniref:GNAT family N-acetyltransferase n=1 Tax=Fusibacter ferrireducens TaxID=2785058 RepID=A0ABR9ZT54_9FIRM|nr:GNAT family N-acetyltransferase [Fusibacter ferrireducens]MBF4693652.1 GNAT family N-acetyltransferase [Fusibacter ferrireducens]
MVYRYMKMEELESFLEIDRREVIEHVYYYRDGKLELEEEYYEMDGFPEGEQQALLERQRRILEGGGYVIGAYNGDTLIGITSVENKLRGKDCNYIKMDILFVSKNYRGRGIAKALMESAVKAARKLNGKKLYISATPSENTINFYFSMGCVLAKALDEELFNLEPYDIHLELDLEGR